MKRPIVLGAGPAGCAAAITLAREGEAPLLLDRYAEVGDALCGGFMSWRTAERCRALGIDLDRLGAHRVSHLRLLASEGSSQARLPRPAFGLSRHVFDTAMRNAALAAGAHFETCHVRTMDGQVLSSDKGDLTSPAIFLASGKSDIRGGARPRSRRDPALGLRVRAPATPAIAQLIGDTIELHLFDGGYAGIVLQEDGSANICLALRKSLLAEHGQPRDLLDALAADYPAFGLRMEGVPLDAPIDAVAAVPYGFIAQATDPGIYRIGDQAAVIPSLAGEGMGIALASGAMAARIYLDGGAAAAQDFQRCFARAARRPVTAADALWHVGERPLGATAMTRLAGLVPGSAALAMRITRIAA